jgi:hypothetical protein
MRARIINNRNLVMDLADEIYDIFQINGKERGEKPKTGKKAKSRTRTSSES